MALPSSFLDGGTFNVSVAAGVASGVNVQVMGNPDYVIAKALNNYTQATKYILWGQKNLAQSLQWDWNISFGNGFARGILQSAENSTPQLPAMTSYCLPATGNVAVDAIGVYNTSNPPTYASLPGTTVDGTVYTVLMASTAGIAVGDIVRLTNVTGALELSGYSFAVTAVTANTSITLGYMATGGLVVVNGSAATVTKYIPGRFYPRRRNIANITVGATTKIYFTQPNDFTIGENIGYRVSSQYGTQQLNNLVGRVITVTNTATESSIVTDTNSSGFTAFTFPLTASAAAGFSPAMVVPSSSGVVPISGSVSQVQQPPGTNLLDAFDNRNINYIRFGAALFNVASHVSADQDQWTWEAYKCDIYTSNAQITL